MEKFCRCLNDESLRRYHYDTRDELKKPRSAMRRQLRVETLLPRSRSSCNKNADTVAAFIWSRWSRSPHVHTSDLSKDVS